MALHSFAIKRLTVAENRIRGLRFGHSIKNAALVALGIGLVYVIATE